LWQKLPPDIQATIERNAARFVRAQRDDRRFKCRLAQDPWPSAAMIFNEVDQAPFRARMAPVYAAWREKLGSKCWPCRSHVGNLS